MSLVDEVAGPCSFCDGSAEDVEAIALTYGGRCPSCAVALEDDVSPLEEVAAQSLRDAADALLAERVEAARARGHVPSAPLAPGFCGECGSGPREACTEECMELETDWRRRRGA